MKIKIDIISGFLGSGKTTLIKKLIEERINKQKIMIIENEFGEVGIDGKFLEKLNVNITEINSGCICCSVSGDFTKAVTCAAKEYKPERIIIEPTGIAMLSEILSSLKKRELSDIISIDRVITVVDASKYEMFITNFSEFYKNQIINAETIFLSHTDNVSEEKLEDVKNKIRQINPKAIIVTNILNAIKAENTLHIDENNGINIKALNISSSKCLKSIQTGHKKTEYNQKHLHGMFDNWGKETYKYYSKESLVCILDKIKNKEEYGNIIRAKGIVKSDKKSWTKFDYVNGEVQIEDTESDSIGKICVIGNSLKKENLNKLFIG